MKKTFLPLTLFALLLSSCCEDSGDLFWNVLLPETPGTGCDSTKATPFDRLAVEGYLPSEAVTDGSKALLTSSKSLYWSDLSTGAVGKKIESPMANKAFSNTDAVYRHGDLAVAASSTSLAVFNVKTGELAWERTLGDCDIDLGVYGTGDQFFVTQTIMEPDGVKAQAVFVGNLQEPGRLDRLFTPAFSRTIGSNWAGYGRISAIAPFTGADGHVYLLTAFWEPQANSNALLNFVGLYDMTTRTWVYDHQPVIGTLPNHATGIRRMVIADASAYLSFEDKVLQWNLAEGKIQHSITVFNGNSAYGAISGSKVQNLWVNAQYIVAATDNSGGVQVFDRTTHAVRYRLDKVSGTVQTAFDVDRLVVADHGLIEVYALSTGRQLETIVAPCEGFSGSTMMWKDAQGYVHLAVGSATGSSFFRYNLQK